MEENMKKFITKTTVKALIYKQNIKAILMDKRGGPETHTDHAGYIMIGVLLLGIVFGFASGFFQNTVFPTFTSKWNSIFS
jgi:hypothetical protein